MIPLRDDIRTRRRPFVNWAVIGICAVVWLLQLQAKDESSRTRPTEQPEFTFGMIPRRVLNPDETLEVRFQQVHRGRLYVEQAEIPPLAFPAWLTVLTCIFLHGGWLHFIGNMWFLHIFGDNVEDRLGHVGFAVFYLATGVVGSLAHLVVNPESAVPTIGASGAIAGVMGGYFVLFPKARVLTLVPIFYFLHFVALPAGLFLGIWFLLQFLQQGSGGVAWWAHIGGFAAGAGTVFVLRWSGKLSPDVERYYGNRKFSVDERNGWL